MSDGIEVHFDSKRGYLELACEPDAFIPYLELARQQLKELSELSFDTIVEINVTNASTSVGRANTLQQRIVSAVLGVFIVSTFILSLIGLVQVVKWIVT